MTEITKELLAIEDEQRKSMQSKFGGQNMRHRWSDTFGNRTGTMKLLIRVNQLARTKKRRASVAKLINKIKENSKHISDDLRMNMVEIPETTATEGEWKLYDAQNRHIITTMMKGTHLRTRTKWRREMKELKHKREEQRKNATTVKNYYNYVLKRPGYEPKPTVLYEKLNEHTKIIDGEKKIREKEIEVTKKHMGKDRKKWYIHNNKILPEFDNTVKGKTWRRKLQDGRMKKKTGSAYQNNYEGYTNVHRDAKQTRAQEYTRMTTVTYSPEP